MWLWLYAYFVDPLTGVSLLILNFFVLDLPATRGVLGSSGGTSRFSYPYADGLTMEYIRKEENHPIYKIYPISKDYKGAKKQFEKNQKRCRRKNCDKARARAAKTNETSTMHEPLPVGCFLYVWADSLHLRFVFAARSLVYMFMLAMLLGSVSSIEEFTTLLCALVKIAWKILFKSAYGSNYFPFLKPEKKEK